jgi:hypothetical protein
MWPRFRVLSQGRRSEDALLTLRCLELRNILRFAPVSSGPLAEAVIAGVARDALAEIRKAVDRFLHRDGVARALDHEQEPAPLTM